MPLIAGRVVDENGQPVAWARVMFTRAPVTLPDIAAMTAEDGSFTLSVPQHGSYEISSYTDDRGEGKTVVDVGGDRQEIEVRVGR